MPDIIHKRSSTPSAVPTTSSLRLGELAINTHDGRIFTKKDDGAASIVELLNTVNGLALTGGTLTGPLILSGTPIQDLQAATKKYVDDIASIGTLRYAYSSTVTAGDPGNGTLRFNNASLALATTLYISETDGNAQNVANFLASWVTSTATIKGILVVTKATDPSVFYIYSVTARTDNGVYNTITVAFVSGSGTISNTDRVYLDFSRSGNNGSAGATGAHGGETEIMTWSSTTTQADPGTGIIRYNNATISAVTALYVDILNAAGSDITAWLDSMDDSSSDRKATLTLRRTTNATTNWAKFYLKSIVTQTGYRVFNVEYIDHAGTLTTTASAITFSVDRVGDAGKTILNGAGAPSNSIGLDGDFYFDTTNLYFYGPKTAGAWGSPLTLSGIVDGGTF